MLKYVSTRLLKYGGDKMPFEFVHVTPSQPKQDAAASTRVRVQAMRDYRQRQDEQRRRSRTRNSASRSQSSGRQTPSTSPIAGPSGETPLQLPVAMLAEVHQVIEMHRAWIMSYNNQQLLRIVKVATAPWRFPASSILMHAQCLEALAHLHATGHQGIPLSDAHRTRVKLLLLQMANARVADPDIAHHDDTLAALASLATYEMFSESGEAGIHVLGIRDLRSRAVDRGERISNNVTIFLELVDLLNALLSGAEPVYAEEADIREPPPVRRQPSRQARTSARRPRHNSAGSFSDEPDESTIPSNSAETIDSKRQSWYLAFLGEISTAASSEYGPTIEQMGNLAASLFQSRGDETSSRTPDTDWQEESLFQEFLGSQDIPWARFGTLHIRILLISLAFSTTHRLWYLAHLSRALYHVSWQNWPHIKSLVFTIIQMKTIDIRESVDAD